MPDDEREQASEHLKPGIQARLKTLLSTRYAGVVAWSVFAVGVTLFLLRAGMVMAPFFEARANAWLEDAFDARLVGLRGTWYGMTPEISLKRIEFAQGIVEDVVVEIDLARSLFALAPRIKALEIGSADVTFAEDFDLLASLTNAPGRMDLRSIMGSAEYLSGNLRVQVGIDGAAMLMKWLVHAGADNRGRIWVRPEAQDDDTSQGLVFGFDLDQGLGRAHVEGALWAEGALHIPDVFATLIGLAGNISRLDARVRVNDQKVLASADLNAERLRVGDYLIDAVNVFAKGAGTPLRIMGEFQQARIRRGDQSLDFAGTTLAIDSAEGVWLRLPDQDIGRLSEFASVSAVKDTVLVRWLNRFKPAGRLEEASVHVGAGSPVMLGGRLEAFSAASWMGSPALRNVSAKAVFADGGARLLIDTTNSGIELEKLFADEVVFVEANGEVMVQFLPGYVGMHGRNLRATLADGGEVVVNMRYSAPVDPAERQISGSVQAFALTPAAALQFIPNNLPDGMRAWLEAGVQGGEIKEGQIVLSGYVRRRPPVPTMQVEMWADWRDGTLLYHPRWPVAESVSGRVALQGGVIGGQVERARVLGMRIEDFAFEMPLRGRRVHLRDVGEMPADGMLRLLVESPLGDMLPVARDQLEAVGLVEYELSTNVPFRFNRSDFELDLGVRLWDVDFGIRSADDERERFSLTELDGEIEYVFPKTLKSERITGTMFGQAMTAVLGSGRSLFDASDRLQAEIRSTISAEYLRPYLGSLNIDGEMRYAAHVEIEALGEAAPRVRLWSDLQGMEIDLAAGLGKDADEATPLLVELEMTRGSAAGNARFSLDERVGGMLAWQPSNEGRKIRGAITFGAEHSRMNMLADLKPGVRIFGELPRMTLDELRALSSGGRATAMPDLHFEALRLGGMDLGSFALQEVSIDGLASADAIDLKLEGESLSGTWTKAPGGTNRVSLAHLHLASTDEGESAGAGELLADIDLRSLPEVDAAIESLKLGDNDYGAWRFGLRQIDDGVRFLDLEARSRGFHIRATEDLVWRKLPDGTYDSKFVGELATDDLADAMAAWGFAPSVEAERAMLVADLSWADAPWKPKLEAFDGEIDLIMRRGRFRDFEAGAGMRLLTLLDFNAFLQRLTFDFSDAFGEGVAFDEVQVKNQFESGIMHMVEPVRIDGNGGRFRIHGNINLVTGELDNQFEATLKISRSLPWLAGYLALLGNPVTGLSVVVAERILRDRLEDFSTARYSVTGTLSEPVFSLAEVEPPEPLPQEILEPPPAEAQELQYETPNEQTGR
ncbi:MAG: DUF3971 domain-containing protein [Gammaproteobacteria bacterium]|nr:DUF3971 domain-containing protein [Gammaproteobacteria bacterium]MCY4276472.1 DUF3971 domain-containing protein [Gammaproteobacteria bacterium]MCY4324117.1 DUF3971 domain-containing protein [Gammaproteobacteria bacterium]